MAVSSSIIGRTLGHYRVLEQVGAGGGGVVFRAHDERLDRDVALKVLRPGVLADEAARSRFRKEALTLSRLSHSHIAHVYDFDSQDGVDFLVMEFVRGVTLQNKLAAGPFPEEEVIHLGKQIATTMEEVSEFGIVHRDLKPANIILTPAGDAKLLDFGLAKLMRGDDVTASMQERSEMAGTLPYMSPEQIRGGPTDFRSDIYSLGAVLYEISTGKRAFPGDVATVVMQDIVRKSPVPPRELNFSLSAGMELIIMRCLAKEPVRRYQRPAELRASLEAIEGSRSSEAAIPRRKKPLPTLAAAGLILALAAAGVMTGKFRRSPARIASEGPVKQLAILPPRTAGDVETAAFGNGLIQTLTSRLSELTATHPLQVVPSSEIREQGVTTLQQAVQQFGANLGLEVNVERSGSMVRVNYALVDAKAHRQVQGDTITASSSDPFAVEDRVAESVVKALEIQLRPEEQKALANHGTEQPASYDYYLQGRGYLQDFQKPENVDNAIVEFDRALQYDRNYALAWSGLGEAYWRKYEHSKQAEWVEKGKAACAQAVTLRADLAAAHLCLGLVDAGTGAYEKAAEEYEAASKLEPTSDEAYSGMARAYEQLGQPEKAESTFRKAISLRPSYWATYNWLGIFYLARGRFPEAASMFEQVIALAPDSFAGYGNLGAAYVQSGEYAKAIPALQRSAEIRPTAAADSNLAYAYFNLRQYPEAARLFEAAATLDPENFEIWGNVGDAYYWSPGERIKARNAYQKARSLASKVIAVNPRDANTLAVVAYYEAMSGDSDAADHHIRVALSSAPKDPDVLFTAALVFNQRGKTDKALSCLEKAVAAGYSRTLVRDTPNFDNLRLQPRLRKLLALS